MGAPISDLQDFFEFQMQQNNEFFFIKIQNCDILFEMF
jgi:hypothetical protein